MWLEIPEKRITEAISQVEKENFLDMSKVLEQGNLSEKFGEGEPFSDAYAIFFISILNDFQIFQTAKYFEQC